MHDLQRFIKDCTRTESVIDTFAVNPTLFESVLQLFIASGNMLDQIKKHVYYGKPYDSEKLKAQFVGIVQGLDNLKPVIESPSDNEVGIDIDTRTSHAMIGAATESVELMEALVTHITEGTLDKTNVLEEFFDMLYYCGVAHDSLDQNMSKTLNMGIQKLRHRYPDKFTSEQAINRDLKTEREILEKGSSK